MSALLFGCTGVGQLAQGKKHHASEPEYTNPQARLTQIEYPTQLGFTTLDCKDIQPNQSLKISKPTQLSAACTLHGVRFVISKSDVALDCRGAWLIGGETGSAFDIVSDKPISNIEVSNCSVSGYGHALNIRQKMPPRVRYLAGNKDPESLRRKAPQQITIKNLSSFESKNSAVFIGDHVHHVVMDGLNIQNAGTVGVYFEFGSQHNVVKNSRFVGNGHRAFKPSREAIAIDSSSYNHLEKNTFSNNGAGAIFLYRNCFEHADDTTRGNHFLRTESSDFNIIKNNTIEDENTGIWVASRQSRNLKGFDCGAYEIKSTLFSRYHEDAAEKNLLLGNVFNQVKRPIVVEDDDNTIEGNRFKKVDFPVISIGSDIRAQTSLGSVKKNTVKNNTAFADCYHCDIGNMIKYTGGSAPVNQCGNRVESQTKGGARGKFAFEKSCTLPK